MDLVLTDDQRMLAETARDFVASTKPVTRLRKLRDAQDSTGFSPDVWQKMAELGWTGVPFSEDDGGLGLGLAEVVLITEALGRGLCPEPFVGSVLLGGLPIALAGTGEQKAKVLEPLIAGSANPALAYYEKGMRHALSRIRTKAVPSGDGFRIDGVKDQVIAGPAAETLLVLARTSGDESSKDGLTLFLVPKDTPGVAISRQWRIDGASTARVSLTEVSVGSSSIVGKRDHAHDVLGRVYEAATIAATGEMLGGMSAAFEQTLRYLKERTQFGTLIGTFQALKHRAARLFIEIELTRSAVMAAARAYDEGSEDAERLCSVAKARASDAYVQVANEAIQMHGGIGMTDEHDIGFFLKHARACEQFLGDSNHHRDRYAALSGF